MCWNDMKWHDVTRLLYWVTVFKPIAQAHITHAYKTNANNNNNNNNNNDDDDDNNNDNNNNNNKQQTTTTTFHSFIHSFNANEESVRYK